MYELIGCTNYYKFFGNVPIPPIRIESPLLPPSTLSSFYPLSLVLLHLKLQSQYLRMMCDTFSSSSSLLSIYQTIVTTHEDERVLHTTSANQIHSSYYSFGSEVAVIHM